MNFSLILLFIVRNWVNLKHLTPVAASDHILKTHFNKNIGFTKSVRELDIKLMGIKNGQPQRIIRIKNELHKLLVDRESALNKKLARISITEKTLPVSSHNLRSRTEQILSGIKSTKTKTKEDSSYNLRSKSNANKIQKQTHYLRSKRTK